MDVQSILKLHRDGFIMGTFEDFVEIDDNISISRLFTIIVLVVPKIENYVSLLVEVAARERLSGNRTFWTNELTKNIIEFQDVVRTLSTMNNGNQFFDKMFVISGVIQKLDSDGFFDVDFTKQVAVP